MKLLLVLGNQLFDPRLVKGLVPPTDDLVVYLREDEELCVHFKYHKHKIIFFLAAMREYAEELRLAGFRVHYEKLDDVAGPYENALGSFIAQNKIHSLGHFEIEDKFFATRISTLVRDQNIAVDVLTTPMFLTTREQFHVYLQYSSKPFMKNFYERQRKRLRVLVDQKGKPEGGQWSFDADNRKPLPRGYHPPEVDSAVLNKTQSEVQALVARRFADHPGDADNFWLPTDRKGARRWLRKFLKERFSNFGPYEDALSGKFPFICHSVLTPFLNAGLLTPEEVITGAIGAGFEYSVPLNSVEGFVRQIIGWREFVRGIYQNFSEKQDQANFWQHERKLTAHWWKGNTGIEPLDDVIKKVLRFGYAHHIERLMVVGNLMLLLEIEPRAAHAWFMELFIDSSDWVMGPNVYGMGIFSDGGIFATKPYICGSNYYRKMGGYKDGDWQAGVDGLYWGFVEKHKKFFLANPRLSMMVRTVEKMDANKKSEIYSAANKLRERLTQ